MRFITSFSVAIVAVASVMAAELPPLSNDNTENWMYIRFATNETVIEDTGADAELRNREAQPDADGQLWKLTGTYDECVVTSRSGRQMFYNPSSNRFYASTSGPTLMKLVGNDQDKWELQLADGSVVSSANCVALVMNGGSGVDKYLDMWKHNFAACGLEFVLPSEMEFTHQGAPAAPAEASLSGKADAPSELLSLWYRKPASNWVKQALPIGNGDIGAMIFGGITQDRIQFNHKTLWRGSDKVGDLGTYLPFGDLYITELEPTKSADSYIRSLDLNRAVATVDYSVGGSKFSREYFASNPDGVIAVRYVAETPGGINVELQFINAQGHRATYSTSGATFSGSLSNGMLYNAGIRLKTEGGTVSANGNGITVRNATELTVYLTCGTDFDPTKRTHLSGLDPAGDVDVKLTAAVSKGYAAVKESHLADFGSLFGRVDFALDGAANDVPTNELLKSKTSAHQNMTDMLTFCYGRYLTIASSRGIDVPSNLQGIWNKDGNATQSAVWASDIHSNINVQMNYWPVESTNLSECHGPLLNFIKNEALRAGGGWQRNARDLGVNEGWVVNTAGNIFGGSSNYKVGKYSVANAWLCDHLWQHYAYTLDRRYLTEDAWPVMRGAVRFWLKRLVESKNGDGTLECPNEYSPEQGRIQNATAHSQQLVGMLFRNSLKAIEVMDNPADNQLRDSIAAALGRLDTGLRIDSKGLLREWKYQENTPNLEADKNYFASDEDNVWQGHRHTSHLMELYPGFEIDPGNNGEIFKAAVASLADRGDVATGWARAWRISLWSRARNAERAYTTLRGFTHHTDALTYDWHGGLYDNMLDAHATTVFQIEGNFGATAGIAEMLMQSRPDSLVLLPALPEAWSKGSVSGLKARGNFEVDIDWADGKLKELRVKSLSGQPLTLSYPGISAAVVTDSYSMPAEILPSDDANRLGFKTVQGMEYVITIPSEPDSSIRNPNSKQPLFTINNGCINVSNTDEEVSICDMTGRLFKQNVKLRSGFYVVSAGNIKNSIVLVSDNK